MDESVVLLHTSTWYKDLENPTIPIVAIRFPIDIEETTKEIKDISSGDFKSDLLLDQKEGLISFELNKIADGFGNFSITFCDKSWTQIETKLVEKKGRLYFRYGYLEGQKNGNLISPWHSALVYNYSLDFHLEGVVIHMTGIMEGYAIQSNIKTWSMKTNVSIEEAIRDIITKINSDESVDEYIPIIEPMETITVPQNAQEDKNQIQPQFYNKDNYLKTICQEFGKIAKNKQGEAGYVVFIRKTKTGKELHFHTPGYDYATKHLAEAFPVFTLFKDELSPVKQFIPNWDISRVYLMGTAKSWSPEIDLLNKNMHIHTTNVNADNQNLGIPYSSNKNTTLKVTPSVDNYMNAIVTQHIGTQDGAGIRNNIMNNLAANRVVGALTATLQIIGNPSFTVCENIKVLVYIPKGDKSSEGSIHWISGTYMIKAIQETINTAGYFTTFQLITTGTTLVQTAPVNDFRLPCIEETINPSTVPLMLQPITK